MKKIFSIIYLLLSSSFVFAQEELISEEASKMLGKGVYEPNYFSMIFGLFVVVCLIYLTGFVYQRLIKINLKQENNALNHIDIISTTSLGQGRNLHVIKINGKYSLIGATQNNITYIKELDDKEDVEGLNSDR